MTHGAVNDFQLFLSIFQFDQSDFNLVAWIWFLPMAICCRRDYDGLEDYELSFWLNYLSRFYFTEYSWRFSYSYRTSFSTESSFRLWLLCLSVWSIYLTVSPLIWTRVCGSLTLFFLIAVDEDDEISHSGNKYEKAAFARYLLTTILKMLSQECQKEKRTKQGAFRVYTGSTTSTQWRRSQKLLSSFLLFRSDKSCDFLLLKTHPDRRCHSSGSPTSSFLLALPS